MMLFYSWPKLVIEWGNSDIRLGMNWYRIPPDDQQNT
jgi:hypothetical protein